MNISKFYNCISGFQREHKDRCRQLEQMKRDYARLQQDLAAALAALAERDRLIEVT